MLLYVGGMGTPLRGDAPRTDAEREFLTAFSAHVSHWAVPDVALDAFRVVAVLRPLVVMTDVPGVDVPSGHCTLQIGYWEDDRGCRALQGEWGDEYLLDNHEYTDDGLTVFGLREEPDTYGTLAAKWLERQLQRPVDRQDWLRDGTVVRSRWVLHDTGKRIARTQDRAWFVRGAPHRTMRVRGEQQNRP